MKTISTPLHIEILMHFRINPGPVPRWGATAVMAAVNDLCREGAIQRDSSGDVHSFEATEKGQAWVEAICATPPPVQVWKNALSGEVIDVR